MPPQKQINRFASANQLAIPRCNKTNELIRRSDCDTMFISSELSLRFKQVHVSARERLHGRLYLSARAWCRKYATANPGITLYEGYQNTV